MNPFLVLLICLLSLVFCLESVADLLNLNSITGVIPSEFEGIYDPDKYRTSMRYQKETIRFDLLQNSFFFCITLGFILLGGFNSIDQFSRSFGFGTVGTGLLFVGTLLILRFVLDLPFSIYKTFVLEEKYGFNKTSPGTFVSDLTKGALLTAILGGVIFSGIVLFFEKGGPWAWVYAWAALTLFQILLSYLAPAVILPLFNQFSPLPDGELKTAIEAYARSQNFQLNGIFTMDSSKRSTKSNAFFTGFGRFRKLVLFDTLIAHHSVEELVAVLAHEIGHFKRKHILKSMVLSIVSSAVLFFIFSLLLNNPQLFEAFRMEHISVYASLVFVSLFYSPILRVLTLFTNLLSRKHEFEADTYSTLTYGKPEKLISALKKMSVDHLSHLTPHPLKVALDYSHPPILKRIQALRAPHV